MRSSNRAAITWLLIGIFAVPAGMGEGLHLIPGCGHAVELPGAYFLVGVARSEWAAGDPLPAVRHRQADSRLCYDEGECPICQLSGQGQWTGGAARPVPLVPLVSRLQAITFQFTPACALQPFDARAPPVA